MASSNEDVVLRSATPQSVHSNNISEVLTEKPSESLSGSSELSESPTNLYEDVDLLIEAAFQEQETGHIYESPSGEQISLRRPVSEEHRERLHRLSHSSELNEYTRQYGTVHVYEEIEFDRRYDPPSPSLSVDSEDDVFVESDVKSLIKHYNKLSEKNGRKTAGLPAPTLYEYCIVVGYDLLKNRPYVKSKYPPQKQPHKQIEIFVHPGNGALIHQRNQQYSIILTDYPEHYYGFCRRVLPESSEFCIPLTYCIVTKHNEPKVFYQLLQCIEGH